MAENQASDYTVTSAARLNSAANEWNSSFFYKRKYVFMHAKNISNFRSYNIIESWSGEVIRVINIIII